MYSSIHGHRYSWSIDLSLGHNNLYVRSASRLCQKVGEGGRKFILNFRFYSHNSTDEGGVLFYSAGKMTGGRPMFFFKVFTQFKTEMSEALTSILLEMAGKNIEVGLC